MIADLLRKSDVRQHLESWRSMVSSARAALAQKSDPKALAAAQKYNFKDEDLASLEKLLNDAMAGLEEEEKGAFIASNPALSIVQTLFEHAYQNAGMVDEPAGQGLASGVPAVTNRTLNASAKPSSGQALFAGIFDDPNPLYILEGVKAVAWQKIHGKHPFPQPPKPFVLGDKARLVIVGDWGTGIPRADVVAKLMRKKLDEAPAGYQRHAIHLGDIYFCGWPSEAKERFLDHWPVRAGEDIASWCLNGNHDMYCGGYGYFDVVLADPRFAQQGGCSYFILENDRWQLLGLDSAYEEWSFSYGQIAWAEEQRRRASQKKGLLLSHHQPISAYEPSKGATSLANETGRLLHDGLIDAWIWGHEHRAVVYKPSDFTFEDGTTGRLPFGCCLGHGGVPSRPTAALDRVLYALTKTMRSGLEKFGLFGFAVLDIDGTSAQLTLIDELEGTDFTQAIG